jgi:hypothetical protein
VVRRDQAVQCNNLKRRLRRGWFLQHHNNESKTPGLRQGFVSSLRRLQGRFFICAVVQAGRGTMRFRVSSHSV